MFPLTKLHLRLLPLLPASSISLTPRDTQPLPTVLGRSSKKTSHHPRVRTKIQFSEMQSSVVRGMIKAAVGELYGSCDVLALNWKLIISGSVLPLNDLLLSFA
jgi:hypothetical protein